MSGSVWKEDDEDEFTPRQPWWYSRPTLILITTVLVVALILGVWFVFKATDNEQVPMLCAETTPLRVEPITPGGMEIPYKESMVYETVAKNGGEKVVEHVTLAPAPEQPMMEGRFAPPPRAPKKHKHKTREEVVSTVETVNYHVTPTEMLVEEPNGQIVEEVGNVVQEQIVQEEIIKKRAAKLAHHPKGWRIQLASLKTRKLAEKEWQLLLKTHKDVLKGMTLSIIEASLGAKGRSYRVQAGSLPNREVALDVCKDLKTRGVSCLVVAPGQA